MGNVLQVLDGIVILLAIILNPRAERRRREAQADEDGQMRQPSTEAINGTSLVNPFEPSDRLAVSPNVETKPPASTDPEKAIYIRAPID